MPSVVVDAAQQDRLIQQRDARVRQLAERRGNVGVQFAGMIRVDDHDGRQASAAEPGEQFVGDPLRNHDRQPGMDPQTAEMGDACQHFGSDRPAEIPQRQRVPAAEDDLPPATDRGRFRRRRRTTALRSTGL